MIQGKSANGQESRKTQHSSPIRFGFKEKRQGYGKKAREAVADRLVGVP